MPIVRVAIENLRLEYANQETGERHLAIDGVTFDVLDNEFLCLLGPSGSGKSTILSSIGGFLPPASGAIKLDGRDISGPGADRGMVFQEYALLPWLKVIDNVAFGLKMRGIPKAERYTVARRYLEVAGLMGTEQKYPHELSGGMKQRVAVVRTLANTPDIMLMDEPFGAIDAQNRMNLQEELLRIWSKSRITVLFVTHSVEEAVFLGDRVAVLTTGPGKLRSIIDVDIPREDRSWAKLSSDPRFNELKNEVLGSVRGLH